MKGRTLLPNKRATLAIAASAAVLLAAFQNCGSSFEPRSFSDNPVAFSSNGSTDLIPPTDKLDPACATSPQFDACLFLKNPVAQGRQVITGNTTADALGQLQTFGVKITGLGDKPLLSNRTINVETLQGATVDTRSPLKFAATSDGDRRFQQIATYYWLNRAIEYIGGRTQYMPAYAKSIRVVVDDSIAGWSPRTNSIHLRHKSDGLPMAWSAELALHFFGLANLHYATQGQIEDLTSAEASANHAECNYNPAGCCTSSRGCARAIASGVGDYFAAMMFPDQPVIGETWANNLSGIKACTITRDLVEAKTRTTANAFTACAASNRPGDVHALGTVYASIWWEVRLGAGPAAKDQVDTLFMRHLAQLNGSDNFVSAIAKIKNLDRDLYGGRFTPLFDAQALTRGL